MAHRVVILGGGTGGTLTANRLRRLYPESDAEITVIDQDDQHVYQPGLLFLPSGWPAPSTSCDPGLANFMPGSPMSRARSTTSISAPTRSPSRTELRTNSPSIPPDVTGKTESPYLLGGVAVHPTHGPSPLK